MEADLIVQMRRGNTPGGTGAPDDISAPDFLAGNDIKPREMGVESFYSTAVLDDNQFPVGTAPSCMHDYAISCCMNGAAHWGRKINTGVNCSFT